ncbi:MAG TPA: TVP38/TMEM64 family protein [Methylomirabilota bacterium]|nr:TVP38/TMEM64 family protein [Methylomirabilota bacterium]
MTERGGRGAAWRRPLLFAALVIGAVVLARHLGAGDLASREGLERARQWVEELGALGPLVFIAVYVLAAVAFVPALPLTVVGGLLFGPLKGTVYASIASTLGACAAFLIARYAARHLVERWIARSPTMSRLDQVTARHGYRLVMITRVVPIFPFNLQNYAYGLTGIGFGTYALTSWLGMLPATVAFTVAGGSIADGGWDVRRVLPWLGAAVLLLILLSLLSRWLRGKSAVLDDLLGSNRG